MIVWLLTGIWHGANWTFIAWGLFYLFLLVIEKQTGLDKKKAWWGHIYTMFFVVIAWVLFKANTIEFAFEYLKVMFYGFNKIVSTENVSTYTFVMLAIACITSFPFKNVKILEKIKTTKLFDLFEAIVIVALFVLTVIFISSSSYSPFIYFNF